MNQAIVDAMDRTQEYLNLRVREEEKKNVERLSFFPGKKPIVIRLFFVSSGRIKATSTRFRVMRCEAMKKCTTSERMY